MNNRLVVFDPGLKDWMDNQIFDEAFAKQWPGGFWPSQLSKMASSRGISIETIDCFANRNVDTSMIVCLMVMAIRISPIVRKIISSNRAFAGICVCLESPLNASDFYHNLDIYASWFKHIFMFAGAKSRVRSIGTTFHPIVWPYEVREMISKLNWMDRKFLTLINSNRRAEPYVFPRVNLRYPRNSLKLIFDHIHTFLEIRKDPWFGCELYLDRIESIKHFSKNPTMFQLYGRGWDSPVLGAGKEINRAVQNVYRGEIPPLGKLQVLSHYKFAICFENNSFPGYITEKILDCFTAGCIPIYLGAPDISSFVPEEAFIDFRKFGSYWELEEYLMSLGEDEAKKYLDGAHDFFVSPAFERFKSQNLAGDILASLEDCFALLEGNGGVICE